MTPYQKFKNLKIDHAAIGLMQRECSETYFCTPKGAHILGWAGVDGIHYCTIRGFGETVFAVSPMNGPGEYVHPIARNFIDLLRLLLGCFDMAALEQCWAWDADTFLQFLLENPPTIEQKIIISDIREKFYIEPMENPFAYIKELQAGFDYASIPYPPDYYDPDMNPHAEPEALAWKVYYEGGPRKKRRQAGKEVSIGKTFRWGNELWHIPAMYLCSEGLVMDLCMESDPALIKAFIEKWELIESFVEKCEPHREKRRFSKAEIREIEQEHPLQVSFTPRLLCNGKPMMRKHGTGNVWIPASCLPEGERRETEAEAFLSHYGLDPEKGWTICRCHFPWATRRRPEIKSLLLTMEREHTDFFGSSFSTPAPGESVVFSHPITGMTHTLTVQEVERKELEQRHFHSADMEYPTHYTAFTYILTPDIAGRGFRLQDCDEGDAPRQKKRDPDEFSPVASASIGIIGGADGPTAIFLGNGEKAKIHAAFSSLHFAPVEEVWWQPVFSEKLMEDITIQVIEEVQA